MGVLYVTSLHDGDGKTAFCAGLAVLLRHQGHNHSLFKPVRIVDLSVPSDPCGDAAFFARLQGDSPPTNWPVPVTPEEARSGLRVAVRAQVMAAFDRLASQTSGIIAEGPSMFTSGGETVALAPEIAEAMGASVVLLARYAPTLTVKEVQEAARSFGSRLLGIVINGVIRYRSRAAQTSLIAPLKEQSIPVPGVLPEERCLNGVTVGQLAEHLGGEFLLCEDKRDQLVEHLMIGGLVLDWGVHYFSQRESKAAIIRWDRPDIQMAALSTPTSCLVLTGGHRPIQYVEHEAREEGVPIILVKEDTLTTAKALDGLFYKGTVHHPAKAECFATLLDRAMDLEAVTKTLNGTE